MATVKSRNISIRSHFGFDRGSIALNTLYFALFAGDPVGAGVEPTSVGGYARKAVSNDAVLWGTISSSAVSVTNVSEIVFAAATGVYSESVLTHWAIFDNATGGNLVYSGRLSQSISVSGAGDVPRFPAGALTVTQQ